MEFKVNDSDLDAAAFIRFATQIWNGDYDPIKTQAALSKTLNITAYDSNDLVGCLRILTDGYFLAQLRNCLSSLHTKTEASAAACYNSPGKIPLHYYILAHNRRLKNSMKKTVA